MLVSNPERFVVIPNIDEGAKFVIAHEAKENISPKETSAITMNGTYNITPSKGYDAMREVEVDVDVQVPPPPLEEKQVTITKAKTTEIITPDAEYGLSRVEVSTDIPLESKQINITENGTTTIEASEGFEGIESVEVTTDVNTLQGLDFEGVFNKEQADEINQYYKDGIAYARSIVNIELRNNAFDNNEQLIIYPTPYKKTGSLNATFLRCYYLEYFTHAELTALGSTLNDTFNYCYSLKNSPTINCSSVTAMNYTFRVCYNLESVTLINISKCKTFNYPFDQCYGLKKCHISQWKQTNLSISSSSRLLPESIHYNIQNAVGIADGATARTLILHATAYNNWVASEYYEQDQAVLPDKGITVAKA